MAKRPWTGAEVRALARLYPTGGASACRMALAQRSIVAIYSAAAEMGLKRLGRKPGSGCRR